MTHFVILTLFENMFVEFKNSTIIKRAIDTQKVKIETLDIRKFSEDKHRRVDFPPYGGGSGMIISAEPLSRAIDFAMDKIKQESNKEIEVIYMSPRGKTLNYNISREFAFSDKNYILICGHYEGIDERIIEEYNVLEISIGDYVLTGGELAAQVLLDSIVRLIPGVISEGSLDEESHTNGMLEYPQYTKPYEFRDKKVPDILISGHHENISKYRKEESIRITKKYRPELLKNYNENK
jgi:tRNA (guanine37-N1)-methyltransferase